MGGASDGEQCGLTTVLVVWLVALEDAGELIRLRGQVRCAVSADKQPAPTVQ